MFYLREKKKERRTVAKKVGHCVLTFQMSKPTAVVPTPVLLALKLPMMTS